jgi:hypothetical protein
MTTISAKPRWTPGRIRWRSFQPEPVFIIQLETITAQAKIVDSITIDAAGTLEIPTTILAADLPYVRFTQSGDIVFLACQGQQQRKIERAASIPGPMCSTKPMTGRSSRPTGPISRSRRLRR